MRLFTTLKAKIILSFIALMLLLGIVTSWLVYSQITKNSRDTLIKKGKGITQAMVESSRHLVLTDNTIRLQELIDALKLSDNEISYIYIADHKFKPLVHTFKGNVPDDLLSLTTSQDVSGFKCLYLKTDDDFIHHIIMPIDRGRVGFISLGLSDFYRRQRIDSLLRNMVIVASLCITFGIIGMYILSSIITKSLSKLTLAVRKVGSGEFDVKVDISTGDEISELAKAFNKMSIDLGDYIRRLNESENNLHRARQMAAIGQMSAALAHEINNPIDGIQRSINIIRASCNTSELNKTLFNLIADGLKQIEHTVKQLLAYGRYQPHFESADINNIIEKAVNLMQLRLKDGQIQLELNLDRHIGFVQVDSDGIQQIIFNLLLNSVDAMNKKGKILIQTRFAPRCPAGIRGAPLVSIGAESENNFIEVIFSDNGPGIPVAVKDKIFEPFFSTKEIGKGAGLGLSIVRNIVEEHNGVIVVESDAGIGTRFLIRLPLSQSMPIVQSKVLS